MPPAGLLLPTTVLPEPARPADPAHPGQRVDSQRSASVGSSALPERLNEPGASSARACDSYSSSAAPPDTPSSSVGPSQSLLARHDTSRISYSASVTPRPPTPTLGLGHQPVFPVLPLGAPPPPSAGPSNRTLPADASLLPQRKRLRLDDEHSHRASSATSLGAALGAASVASPAVSTTAGAAAAPPLPRKRKKWFSKSRVDPWRDVDKAMAAARWFSDMVREDERCREATREGKEEDEPWSMT